MPVYKSKEITNDGRCWFYKVWYQPKDSDISIPKISKKYASKQEAIIAEQEFIHMLEKNKNVPLELTFLELHKKYLEIHGPTVKDSTYKGYLYMAKELECFYKLKCLDINYHHFEAWRKRINKRNISIKSKNKTLKYFKAILNFGSDYYGFNFDSLYRKMKKFKNKDEVKKEMKYYTLDEFNQFLSVENNIKYYALWETLYFCGLRCAEARGLLWTNIDFEKHTLTVKQTISPSYRDKTKKFLVTTPKTKSSIRTIPLCDRLYRTLLNYKNDLIKNNEYKISNYVFGDKDNNPYSPPYIRYIKDLNAELANVKPIRLHDFRHSCASLLINNGAPVTIVSKYLGHSEISEILNTYSHMFPQSLEDVISVVNKLD